jgi:NAD(P)-dependent dehydrogenase (short-subunit alcohol dehydrogenase family)
MFWVPRREKMVCKLGNFRRCQFFWWAFLLFFGHGSIVAKTCLITGAASGLGKEVAIQLMENGYHVYFAARKNHRDTVSQIIQDARQENVWASGEFVELDLTNLASVKSLTELLVAKQTKIDVLINNAGVAQNQQIITDNNLELTFQVNYLGHFLLTHELARSGVLSKSVHIFNIVSSRLEQFDIAEEFKRLLSHESWFLVGIFTGDLIYKKTKSMLIMFTYKLSAWLKTLDITSRCIAFNPGPMKTDFHKNLGFGLSGLITLNMKHPKIKALEILSLLDSKDEIPGPSAQLLGATPDKEMSSFLFDDWHQELLWQSSLKILKEAGFLDSRVFQNSVSKAN